MKNKNLVSRVLIGLGATNKDMRISKRYILEVAVSKAIHFMAQKFNDNSLHREGNILSHVDCFKMEELDTYKCDIVEFKSCETIMKSSKKLPELVYSKLGSSLKEVTNIDYSIDFLPTTPAKYRRDKKREGFGKDKYFYVKDKDLYLLGSKAKRVSLALYTPNTYDAAKISECRDECLNPWDFEFACSSKVIDVVIQETIKEVAIKLNIPVDENPNMSSNQKDKTIA